ncbi:MAG: hypothetical protein KOO63_05695 [Bacteroidales bacterium]|nr:hypothetical protein [Candidatus Latescibacterota bacterium]
MKGKKNEIEQVIEIFQHVKANGELIQDEHNDNEGDARAWQLGELVAYRTNHTCGVLQAPDDREDGNLILHLEHAAAWRVADRLFKILTGIIKQS